MIFEFFNYPRHFQFGMIVFLLCFQSLELLRVIVRTHKANTFGPLLLFL